MLKDISVDSRTWDAVFFLQIRATRDPPQPRIQPGQIDKVSPDNSHEDISILEKPDGWLAGWLAGGYAPASQVRLRPLNPSPYQCR